VRVFDNVITSNDLKNFAPSGNIVANVPVGTGIMLLAAKNVEIFGNTLTENNVMGVGIVSYTTLETLTGSAANDPAYDKYCKEIHIHHNTFSSSSVFPSEANQMAEMIQILFNNDIPDVMFDGYVHPDYETDSTASICIKDNGSADFGNIDFPDRIPGAEVSRNPAPHDCFRTALQVVTVSAPAMN